MDGTLAHARAAPTRRAWVAEAWATLALAWPIALTNLSGVALLLTDTMIVGRLGTEALLFMPLVDAFIGFLVLVPLFPLGHVTAA